MEKKWYQIFFLRSYHQAAGTAWVGLTFIVESTGGQLWASANGGGGATFHFTLPDQVTESSPFVANALLLSPLSIFPSIRLPSLILVNSAHRGYLSPSLRRPGLSLIRTKKQPAATSGYLQNRRFSFFKKRRHSRSACKLFSRFDPLSLRSVRRHEQHKPVLATGCLHRTASGNCLSENHHIRFSLRRSLPIFRNYSVCQPGDRHLSRSQRDYNNGRALRRQVSSYCTSNVSICGKRYAWSHL